MPLLFGPLSSNDNNNMTTNDLWPDDLRNLSSTKAQEDKIADQLSYESGYLCILIQSTETITNIAQTINTIIHFPLLGLL